MNELNAREKLEAVANWLAYQHENLSDGLKTPQDAIKLYDYWMAHPELPEFCDSAESDDGIDLAVHRRKALRYDPLGEKRLAEVFGK